MEKSGEQIQSDLTDSRSLRIGAFPLGFVDPDVEKAYRQKWLQATRRDHRLWTVGALIGYGLISAVLWLATGPGFPEFQWFRLFVALPLLVAAAVIVIHGRFSERVYFPLFVVKTMAIYGNSIVSYALADIADVRMYLFESALIFVFVQYFYPVRWSYTTTFAILGTATATIAITYADAGPAGSIVPLEMILIVVFGLAATCSFSSYSKEVFSRRNFVQLMVLNRRQTELETLAEKASVAADAKARFLAIAAHELRTPLNAMLGFTQLAQMNRGRSADHTEYLGRFRVLQRDSNHLFQLAECALSISKDGQAFLSGNRQYFEIEPLLEDAAADFSTVTFRGDDQSSYNAQTVQHLVAGNPGIYRMLTDCLVHRARVLSGRKREVVLEFQRLDEDLFALSAGPVDVNLLRVSATTAAARDHWSDSSGGPDSEAGLLNLLAQSQSATFRSADLDSGTRAFWLEIPADLVTPSVATPPAMAVAARAVC